MKELGVHPTKVVEGIEGVVREACHFLEREAKKISLDDIALEQVVKTSLSSTGLTKAISASDTSRC